MYSALLIGVLAMFGGGLSSNHEAARYECLPKDVQLDEVVTYGRKPADNITIAKKLLELKARCRKKKLVDANNKEIRFFRASCWGNPPPDYLEIKKKEKEEFEKLKKDNTVIVIGCSPRTH
jgi:hypothetical protein